MVQKIIKTGNSLAITISADFAKILGIRSGDSVKVNLEPNKGKMICIFSGIKQLPLSETFLRTKKGKLS